MVKHLEMDDGDAPIVKAPLLKKDGTPQQKRGRKKINVRPTVPDAAHAGPALRRNSPRPPSREQTRDMAREPTREASSVIGRNGEELRRMRPETGGDIFERVKAPPGWSYQWNAITAINKELQDIHQGMAVDFYENGWRPVPASRHPGVWTPAGFVGAIVVKGMRLEERPMELTKEAQREDQLRARTVMKEQTDLLSKRQADLPGARAGRAQQVSGIRMQVDKSFDLPPSEDYDYGDQ